MQTYSILTKIWEWITLLFMLSIVLCILIYFVKETIKNFKRKGFERYDTPKDVRRKIEKEQQKLDKFLKKQLKKVKKIKQI